MATEHRNLTGAELHEPKGAATATNGQVYVANGSGSGTWVNKNADILNLNSFTLQSSMDDIGNTDSAFFYVPYKASLVRLTCVLQAAITTTNAVLSIYVNGVLQTDTLIVPFTGSGAGVRSTVLISTPITVLPDQVVEVRSNGGPANTAKAVINVQFSAIP